jgi:hypothetical protein
MEPVPKRLRLSDHVFRMMMSGIYPAWRAAACAVAAHATAADEPQWLWRERIEMTGKPVDAFLWMAPTVEAPRALLLVARNFAELEFCADPVIRAALAENRMALVLLSPNPGGGHDPPEPAWEITMRVLKQLEKASGVPGLAELPLIPFGHSAAGPWARNLISHQPERMAGMLHYNSGNFAPPAWAAPGLKQVPVLAMNGQFEEFGPQGEHAAGDTWEEQWQVMRDTCLPLRSQGQRIVLAVEPGAGHYCWTGRQAPLVAAFLDAIGRSLERGRDTDGGWSYPEPWLTDAAIRTPDAYPAMPAKDFKGPPNRAWWLPDAEFAKAWRDAHAGKFGGQRQFVKFDHVMSVKYERDFIDPYQVIGPAPGKIAVSAVASSGLPVGFSVIEGPVAVAGSGKFRLRPSLFSGGPAVRQRVRLRAFSAGDGEHAYADREAELEFFANQGHVNVVRFELPAMFREGDEPLKLEASADAGGAVDFSVIAGPAEIRDGCLMPLPVPTASRLAEFNIIVAAGHGGGSGFAAAAPVERTIRLLPLLK